MQTNIKPGYSNMETENTMSEDDITKTLYEVISDKDDVRLVFYPRGNGIAIREALDKHRNQQINTIDLSNAEIGRNEFRHISEGLVHFLLKENIKCVLIRSLYLNHISNICRSKILECFRQAIGDSINVSGLDIPIKYCVNTDIFCKKIAGSDGFISPSVRKTTQVLQNLNTIDRLPSKLVIALSRAHKYVKRRKKNEKRNRLKHRKSAGLSVNTKPILRSRNKQSRHNNSPTVGITPNANFENNFDNLSAENAIIDHPAEENEAGDDGKEEELPKSPESNVNNSEGNGPMPPLRVRYSDLGCYICKIKFEIPDDPTVAQKRYKRLCQNCAEYNLVKRLQSSDLSGMVALVTGGRIKIGYEVVLRLLRDGCRVHVTSRFPRDAAKRYCGEKDFDTWCDRLMIHPLDLKDITGIYRFIEHLKQMESRLDIIINNAAQTIRRPIHFYKHLLPYETAHINAIPETERKIVHQMPLPYADLLGNDQLRLPSHIENVSIMELSAEEPPMEELTDEANRPIIELTNDIDMESTDKANHSQNKMLAVNEDDKPASTKHCSELKTLNINESNSVDLNKLRKSDISLTESNKTDGKGNLDTQLSMSSMFPEGLLDSDGQQVDLRPTNSWRCTMDDVAVEEVFEVMMINTMAPFILNKELKCLMQRSPAPRRFIINVSAVEGQFHRNTKSQRHPHTNMTKAALNMMTRTAALGYRQSGIYMTSVDTGWVSDQNPYPMAQYQRTVRNFETPLDYKDGASRIYDPIVMGMKEDLEPYYAVFLKNYTPHKW